MSRERCERCLELLNPLSESNPHVCQPFEAKSEPMDLSNVKYEQESVPNGNPISGSSFVTEQSTVPSAMNAPELEALEELSNVNNTTSASGTSRVVPKFEENFVMLPKHECQYCGKTFTRKFSLKNHLNNVHGPKPMILPTMARHQFAASSIHAASLTSQHPTLSISTMTTDGNMNKSTSTHRHECTLCGKTFTRAFTLKSHVSAVHVGNRPHPCDVCGKRFAHRDNMKKHRFIHTGEKPYSCEYCGKRFGQRSCLKSHRRSQHGRKSPIPSGNKFLESHFAQAGKFSDSGSFHEPYDQYSKRGGIETQPSFAHSARMKEEISYEKRVQEPKESPIRVPSKPFLTPKEEVTENFEKVTVQYLPEEQQRIERTPYHEAALRYSLLERESQSPHFVKEEPSRNLDSFSNREVKRDHNPSKNDGSSNLNATASSDRTCHICSRVFTRAYTLRCHIKAVHEKQKEYQCDLCDRAFAHKDNLKKHRYTHTGEKPYTCHVCHRRFNQRSVLNTHIKTHYREVLYACMFCDKEFECKEYLQLHLAEHGYASGAPVKLPSQEKVVAADLK